MNVRPARANVTMQRVWVIALVGLSVMTRPTVALADHEMVQSPLLMRRAGPSCQPGNLAGDPGAGRRWYLGPCAGVDATAPADDNERGRAISRHRRF